MTFGSVLAFEHFVLLMAVIFAMQFVDRSLGPIFPLYIASLGVPDDRVPLIAGVVFSAIALAAAIGHHASGLIMARVTPRVVITGGALVTAVAMLGYLTSAHVGSLVVLATIFGAAVGAAMTASYATAGAVLPDTARATGFGFLSSASLAALALSPMASGALAARSLMLVFVVNALLMTVVAAIVWRTMAPGAARRTMSAEAPVVDEE